MKALITIVASLTLFLLSSCIVKTTSNSNSVATTNPSSDGSANTDGSGGSDDGSGNNNGNNNNGNNNSGSAGVCGAEGVNDVAASLDYYKDFYITAPGCTSAVTCNQVPRWSSTLLDPAMQQRLVSDGRLRLRFVMREAPTHLNQNITLPSGETGQCRFRYDYSKLSFEVGIKTDINNPSYNYTFPVNATNVDPGDNSVCSPIYDIPITNNGLIPPSNNPYIIEIFNVQWDMCVDGASINGNGCPQNNVWTYSCYKLDMQVVTDFTYNFN